MQLAVREEPVPTIPTELEQVFERRHGLVFGAAYRVTGNAADAEDVLQTVFLRLLSRDSSSIDNEEGYLRRAAVNAALDIVRARQQRSSEPFEEPPAAEDPVELRDSLRRALARLNPRAAEIFALRFFEGYSNPEIARILGISQVLVAVNLHRTRRQLQKDLGGRP